jgi:hypothetical protein
MSLAIDCTGVFHHHVGGVCEGGTDEEIVFTCRVNVFGHRRRDPQQRQQNQTCVQTREKRLLSNRNHHCQFN